jgi:hypothetical protein
MAKGKKLPAKPTMAQAFNAAQGPAVNRPNAPIDYPGPGASPKARKTQAARMTAQANRGAATENLARRIKTDAARKKKVADYKTDTIRKNVTVGPNPFSMKNLKKSVEIIKAQISPDASVKEKSGKFALTQKAVITKKYKGAGSQAAKNKKKK